MSPGCHLLPGSRRNRRLAEANERDDRVETFCVVELEVIASRCPVIVTDQVPEILQAFLEVLCTAPNDIDGLQAHMTRALRGDQLPADIPIARYDWSGAARRYSDLYQTALRRGSTS
jgi:glycosyltransferase involved in cell wall biosynthesis